MFLLGITTVAIATMSTVKYEAIATFGRADVAGKAMQFALGEEHGIFITTPKDFPDPAPEAKKFRKQKLHEKVGGFDWLG